MKTDVITDADIAAMSDCDDGVLSKIYLAFGPMLRSYAARSGVRDPDDIVQDVFIRFVAAVRDHRFTAIKVMQVVAYLRTLVRHCAVDAFRKSQARCQDLMVSIEDVTLSVPPTVHYYLDAQDDAEIGYRSRCRMLASWKCSDTTKAVFVACVVDGREIADVAAQFGVSCGLVRQIRHRGLARMRALAADAA